MFTRYMPFICFEEDSGAGGGAPGTEAPAAGVETDAGTPPDAPSGEGTSPESDEPEGEAAEVETPIDWSKIDLENIPEEIAEKLALSKPQHWWSKALGRVSRNQNTALQTELDQAKAELAELRGKAPSAPAETEVDPIIAGLPPAMQKTASELKSLDVEFTQYDPDDGSFNLGTPDKPDWKSPREIDLIRNVAEKTAQRIYEFQRAEEAKKQTDAQTTEARNTRVTEVNTAIETAVTAQVKEVFKGLPEKTIAKHQERMLSDAIGPITAHIIEHGDIDEETINGMIADTAKRYSDDVFEVNRQQAEVNAKATATVPVGSKGTVGVPGPVDESNMSREKRNKLAEERTARAEVADMAARSG